MSSPLVRLDRAWLGIMVIHSLNILYGHGCCATCCAPCGVLKEMADTGIINYYIRSAPAHLYEGSEWWMAGGAVDMGWLEEAISGKDAGCH